MFFIAFSIFYIYIQRYFPIVFGLLPLYVAIINHGRRGFQWVLGLFMLFFFGLFLIVEDGFTFHVFRMWVIWTLFFGVIGHVLVQWWSNLRAMARLLTSLQLQTKKLHYICCQCKRMQDDEEEWVPIEHILRKQGIEYLSHGYCTTCYQQFLEEEGLKKK